MFGRLGRIFSGGASRAAEPPAEPSIEEQLLAHVLAIPSPALRQLFERRYREESLDTHQALELIRSRIDDALADDPLAVTLELFARAPAAMALARCAPSGPGGRFSYAFNEAVRVAYRRYGPDVAIPAERLPRLIRGITELVDLGAIDGTTGVYAGWAERVARAARDAEDPAVRPALLALFAALFRTRAFDQDLPELGERLLAACGMPRHAIPECVARDARVAELDAIRARLFRDVGEPLAAALADVLDHFFTPHDLAGAAKRTAFARLLAGSPAQRGALFARAVALIDAEPGYGLSNWTELRRDYRGRYDLGKLHPGDVQGLGTILGVLAVRKLIIPDADAIVARFIGLLKRFPVFNHRKILALLLETGRAHPNGRTCAALRQMAADRPDALISDWRSEIVEMLGELPPPPSALGAGFGPARDPQIAALTPPRPTIDDAYAAREIGRHFRKLLDPRLYDAAHLDLLRRGAELADAIEALDVTGLDRGPAIIALAKERGHALRADAYPLASPYGITANALALRQLWNGIRLFQPLVTDHPERARRLAGLAAEIANKSAPTARWLATARETVAAFGDGERLRLIDMVLDSAPPVAAQDPAGIERYLRALLYLSVDLDPARIGPRLADYALKKCYVTEPDAGIRAERLGNACLWVLANLPDGAGIPFLARMLTRTKYPKIRAKIDARLNDAAAAAGIGRVDLDEVTVPTHDLDADGCRRVALGDGEAVIRVMGARTVSIEWRGDGGKPLKAPSAAMKADKPALKAVREAAREIEADLGTQLVRLQRLYLENRRWDATLWRARYLDQPLLRPLVRRLIWWLDRDGERRAVMADAAGAELCTVDGQPVAIAGGTIALWHPIEDRPDAVEQWRDRLEAGEITQPFAQAWREIYVVTEAERATETYSNRWAAHILRQHQAISLARMNGWRVTHRMWVDAPNDEPWHLTIPAHNLVADYWIRPTGGEEPERTQGNALLYVATDRVQFHEIAAGAADSARGPERGAPVPLVQLPPVVFSEVMRQADLLTAVASIAADPTWLDRGRLAAHPSQWSRDADHYWHRANSGALEQAAERRRAALERIVPRLRIADKLRIDGRYLHVEGKRHSYRIHLGSGACFRGEQHLCIVPESDAGPRIWLPFEGDRILSVILSKAMLLEADDQITDPTILRQL